MSKLPDDIIDMCRSDLEDEVMILRAKLQVQDTIIRGLRDTAHAAEMDRDFWKEETAMWKKRTDQLALDKVFGEKPL